MNTWNRLAPHLFAKGNLRPVDRDAFAAYCLAWARYHRAQQQLAESGEVMVNKAKGTFVVNPWLWIANAAEKQMIRVMVEFGMTPSSSRKLGGDGGAPGAVDFSPDAYERAFGAAATLRRAQGADDRGE